MEVMTEHGPFAFSFNRRSQKPGCPYFATDSWACGVGCSQVDRCYARTLQRLRPRVDRRWSENQRVLDLVEEVDGHRGLVDLFRHGMLWTAGLRFQHFRGWVAGDGSEAQIIALAEAAKKHRIQVWIPSSRYDQSLIGRNKWAVVRRSAGSVEPLSMVIGKKEETPEGAVLCPESCWSCRSCWDASVPVVAYREKRYTKRR